MDWDSGKALRIARAILAGDFDIDAPSRKASTGIALFLAGLGTGVALGVLFAPSSGEKTRTNIGERARQGFDAARSKTQEIGRRAQETVARGREQMNDVVDTAQEAYREEKRTNVS